MEKVARKMEMPVEATGGRAAKAVRRAPGRAVSEGDVLLGVE